MLCWARVCSLECLPARRAPFPLWEHVAITWYGASWSAYKLCPHSLLLSRWPGAPRGIWDRRKTTCSAITRIDLSKKLGKAPCQKCEKRVGFLLREEFVSGVFNRHKLRLRRN